MSRLQPSLLRLKTFAVLGIASGLCVIFGARRLACLEAEELAVVPLRDMRKGEDGTREGIGLARYLARDVRILRPDVNLLPTDKVQTCLSGLTSNYRTRISPRELRDLATCIDTKELLWGTFGLYETRFTVFLDHWLASTGAFHHYEASASAEKVFSTVDRLVLELAEQAGWGVSREQKHALEERDTDSFSAYLAYWEGREQYAKAEYGKALEQFQTAIREDPGHTWARLFTGNVHMRRGDVETASGIFRSLTEEDPAFIPAFVNLGAALMAKRKPWKAIRVYRHAEGGEESPPLQFNLGNARRFLMHDTETRDAYEAAIRLRPDFADAYYQLAIFYKSREVIDRARENFLQARRLRPELKNEIFDFGLPLKDILIEDEESYRAELAYDLLRVKPPEEENQDKE